MTRLIQGILVALSFTMASHALADLGSAQRLLEEGKPKAALKAVESHLSSKPNDPEARFLRGLALAELGQQEKAIEVFKKLTTDFGDLPEPYNNLAVLHAQRGEYDQARQALEAAILTHPSYATAHENLGDIYTILATVAYNRALSLNTGNNSVKVKLDMLGGLSAINNGSGPAAPVQATPVTQVASTNVENTDWMSVEPTTPAATKPAPVAVATTEPTVTAQITNDDQAVLDTVFGWAKAWAKQDVTGYLGSYGKNFEPPKNLTRAQWERQRKSRVTRPQWIEIKLSKPRVEFLADDLALVMFQQNYKSGNYEDNVEKTLLLEKEARGWKIAREESVE